MIAFTANKKANAKARTPRPPLLSLRYSRYGTRRALRAIPALSLFHHPRLECGIESAGHRKRSVRVIAGAASSTTDRVNANAARFGVQACPTTQNC